MTGGTGRFVEVRASDGHVLGAYLAVPEGEARGGLVVVQEAFGVNSYIRSVCHVFAGHGYASIAPAIYDRQRRNVAFDDHSPSTLAEARALRAALRWDDVLSDVSAAIRAVSDFGRVGIVGYCVGGSVAWFAGCFLPVVAVSAYYGRDIADALGTAPRCPTILHFGEHDHLIGLRDVERIRARFPRIPAYVYPAGHGFDRAGSEGHDAGSAQLARERTLSLFREHVG